MGRMEKKMETTIMGYNRVYIGDILGRMEKKMETTVMGYNRVYIGVILGIYWGEWKRKWKLLWYIGVIWGLYGDYMGTIFCCRVRVLVL